jgi:hypothetical protein
LGRDLKEKRPLAFEEGQRSRKEREEPLKELKSHGWVKLCATSKARVIQRP